MPLRERIAKWLRRTADAVHRDPVEQEPKREGLHKMLVTPAQVPVMPNHSALPIVSDTRAACAGMPDSFVVVPLPGDWGNGWDKDCGPFCGGEGGGTYL